MTTDPLRMAMADPAMRLGHYLWHGLREVWKSWNRRDEFAALFPDWIPPNPSLDEDGVTVIRGARAGRDFLHMHRHMFRLAQSIMPVSGWDHLPADDDSSVAVPDRSRLPEASYPGKSNATWAAAHRRALALVDDSSLRNIANIDELGSLIEYDIHALAHQRYGGYSTSNKLRPGTTDMLAPIAVKWNNPSYDSLLDSYSSHVNPLFWSLHGWIDTLIGKWEVFHGPVDWSDAWLGPMKDHVGGHEHEPGMPMEVMQIRSGKRSDGSETDKMHMLVLLIRASRLLATSGYSGSFRFFCPSR